QGEGARNARTEAPDDRLGAAHLTLLWIRSKSVSQFVPSSAFSRPTMQLEHSSNLFQALQRSSTFAVLDVMGASRAGVCVGG
ncbi:MAG: hypothetical protein LC777_17210, partial [Actinobacteria bacterium]|nr:hypothetical protein [Actinomycetota bacterium]